jgi:hypothetical protein
MRLSIGGDSVTVKGTKHGAYALKTHGAKALDKQGRRQLRTIRRELLTPDGVRQALATRAALSVTMVGVLEAYIETEVAAGTELAEIPAVKVWPAYQNACSRALQALAAAQEKPAPQDDAKTVLDALVASGGEQ